MLTNKKQFPEENIMSYVIKSESQARIKKVQQLLIDTDTDIAVIYFDD